MRFSVSGLPDCDCLRTFVSAVFAAIGLLRDGFLLGGEADDEDCDADEEVDGEDLLAGTGTARVTATGLTAVGEMEPCEA